LQNQQLRDEVESLRFQTRGFARMEAELSVFRQRMADAEPMLSEYPALKAENAQFIESTYGLVRAVGGSHVVLTLCSNSACRWPRSKSRIFVLSSSRAMLSFVRASLICSARCAGQVFFISC
jgi:hypothetical protein